MNKFFIAALLAISAFGFSVLPVQAQSGSRLCGWVKHTPTGAIGYLYEAREANTMYTQQCDKNIQYTYRYNVTDHPGNADTQSATIGGVYDFEFANGYKKVRKETCEDVGVMFESSNSHKDMCDYMEAYYNYEVIYDKASNTTTYKRLGYAT